MSDKDKKKEKGSEKETVKKTDSSKKTNTKKVVASKDVKKSKENTKVRIDFKENKTLLWQILGATVVLITAIGLIAYAMSIKKFTVTFDSAGGTPIESKQVISGNKVSKPATPTRDGFTFDGWYYGNEIFDFNTKIEKDITLVARWTEIAPLDPNVVASISLNHTELYIGVGKTEQLIAIVYPETALDKSVSWSSSDSSIVSVDEDGLLTTYKEGTARITVTTTDGEKTAICNVTVTNQVIPITGVKLDKSALNVGVNETLKLNATPEPFNATNRTFTWTSSNPNVATVDAAGNVTGRSEGTTIITVKTAEGNFTATATITVRIIPVSTVNISPRTASVVVNGRLTLVANILPANASDKVVTWKSLNESIATVNASGVVTGVSEGTATIQAISRSGNIVGTATITVTVPVVTTTYRYVATAQKDEFGVTTAYTLRIYEKIGTAAETEVTSGTTVTSPFVNTATVKIISTTELDKITANSNRINIVYGGKEINNVTGTINR